MTAPIITPFGHEIPPEELEELADRAHTFLERPLLAHRHRYGQLWDRLAEHELDHKDGN
jgi:hypothetical protein